jgi:hypothetical protein
MLTTCLNCGRSFEGNFCPECGQKASVKKLTFRVLVHETLHFFTHLEKGFLFTSWNFLSRPGISSIHYVAGKRKEYQPPVSFFLIWTGLYFLQHNAIINHFHYEITKPILSNGNLEEQSMLLFRQHFTLFLIPVIVISAVIIYYLLAKPHYNFAELITLCLFGTGVYFMISAVTDFIIGVVFRMNILSENVFLWQAVLSSAYNFWFSYDFFKRSHLRFFWIRLISVSLLIAACGWIIMFYLPMAWIYFTTHVLGKVN